MNSNAEDGAQTHDDCAAGSSGADTINLPPGSVFIITDRSQELTGLPDIGTTVIIEGNGATISRDSGASTTFRLLDINAFANVTLNRITLSGGNLEGQGAGIRNYGTLTINDSTISHNTTSGTGSAHGGGIANLGGILTLNRCTLFANNAGGLYDARGGAVLNKDGTVTINHSTIAANQATLHGGGIYNWQATGTATLTLNYTIVSGNTDNATGSFAHEIYNWSGAIHANNYNLFGHSGETDSDAYSDFIPGVNDINATSDDSNIALSAILDTDAGGDPDLADNGGGAQTVALVSGSPAIDNIASATCATPNDVDQRGAGRNFDGDNSPSSSECDIGAYEYRAPESQGVSGTGAFNFDSNRVVITVITQGDLVTLTVERMDNDHPLATGTSGGSGTKTGAWWHIMGQDSGGNDVTNAAFNLTLPHADVTTPQVCKYPGGLGGYGWDCAVDSATTITVTRNGLTSFSDWAVGSHTGPTVVQMAHLTGRSSVVCFSLLAIILSIGVALFSMRDRYFKIQRR